MKSKCQKRLIDSLISMVNIGRGESMKEDKCQMPSQEAWEMVNNVDFCRMLREKMIFPELNEISHTAIKNAISELGISEEYLPRLLKLGYIEQLNLFRV